MNSSRGSPFKGTPSVEDFMSDFKEKRKLLVRWPAYFPHETVKEFDVRQSPEAHSLWQPNDFKHLCIQVFFEAFGHEDYQSYLEWVSPPR